MVVRRDFQGWDPADALDPEVDGVLGFLDDLAASDRLPDAGEIVASIDGDGIVQADVPVGETTAFFLQAGDGWDRALWTVPSGHTYEWRWRTSETPRQLYALLAGAGVERTTHLGRRRLTSALVVDGQTLSRTGRLWRPLARLVQLPERERPAL